MNRKEEAKLYYVVALFKTGCVSRENLGLYVVGKSFADVEEEAFKYFKFNKGRKPDSIVSIKEYEKPVTISEEVKFDN